MMVGRWVSFSEGLFSGSMLNFRGGIVYNTSSLNLDLRHENLSYTSSNLATIWSTNIQGMDYGFVKSNLGVGWATPLEKYARQNGFIFSKSEENETYLKQSSKVNRSNKALGLQKKHKLIINQLFISWFAGSMVYVLASHVIKLTFRKECRYPTSINNAIPCQAYYSRQISLYILTYIDRCRMN